MASKQEQIEQINKQIKVLQDELKELDKIPDAKPEVQTEPDKEEHHADRPRTKPDR